MKTPKELALEMLSKLSKEEITSTLKSAGIDQENIETILNEIKTADNK